MKHSFINNAHDSFTFFYTINIDIMPTNNNPVRAHMGWLDFPGTDSIEPRPTPNAAQRP